MNTLACPFRLLFVGSSASCGADRLLDILEAALRGGVDAFLLREKSMPGGPLLSLAREARKRTARAGALFFVSDRIDVALASGADGVQLPENSFTPEETRRLLGPEGRIGRSVHDPAGAREAERRGADFVLAGPVFATPGKERLLGVRGAAELRAALGIPAIPIGGIDEARVPEIRRAGFRAIAVVRAIASAADPEAAARRLRALLEAHLS
ncbi:MAG: thiamine phosphate synthase [Candidatus Eisenbacteria bacterium]|nr:thiamine phosphate synthase [Candidatus Eisenbacteria bacterium]